MHENRTIIVAPWWAALGISLANPIGLLFLVMFYIAVAIVLSPILVPMAIIGLIRFWRRPREEE